MNFDERAANARTDLGTMLDGVDAPPASRIRSVSRRRRALQAGTGALAVAVATLGVVALVERDHNEPVILTPPSTETTTTVAAGVTARLELPTTTVEAGATIHGNLVVENNSGAPLRWGDTCKLKFQVVLRNAAVPNEGVPFTDDCPAVDDLPVGVTTLPFEVVTTYMGCSADPAPGIQPCLPDGGMPLLPAGDYEAVFVSSVPAPVAPRSVPITVTEPAQPVDTTTSSTPTGPTFPAAVEPTHGGTTWAVVIAGANVAPGTPLDSDQTLNSAVAVASRGGYTTGPTDCDQGADVAWGASPDATDFYSVSVYFGSEADARQANEAFQAIGWNSGVVAQLQTFCLD